jgi:hypothetical protein
MNENSQTALVSFRKADDAILVGRMIEKHYIMQKDWPQTEGQIILPSVSKDAPLDFLFCRKWDFEELKIECTKNFLNIVTIDNIVNSRNGLNFKGKAFSFQAPVEFYMNRLEDLLTVE